MSNNRSHQDTDDSSEEGKDDDDDDDDDEDDDDDIADRVADWGASLPSQGGLRTHPASPWETTAPNTIRGREGRRTPLV